jgi:protein-disulfide isomerase
MSSSNETARRLAWAVVTVGGLSAGIAAIWFISLQAFVLKKLCIYCMCAHGCGMLLSAIILWRRPLGKNITSALSGLSVIGGCVLIAGQWLAPPPKTYAEERYDTVDFTSDDTGVFALDTEEGDDPFLLAPVEDLFEVPNEEPAADSDHRVGVLPTVSAPQQTQVPELSPKPDRNLTRGLSDIVSRFSIQLADDITADLADDVDDACREDAGDSDVDARDFESIDKSNAQVQSNTEVPSGTEAGSSNDEPDDPVMRPGQSASIDAAELQRSLAEIASDLADLGIRESAKNSSPESEAQRRITAAPAAQTIAGSDVVEETAIAATSPEPQPESAPQADHQSILVKKEAESIAIVGESLGIKQRTTLPSAPATSTPSQSPPSQNTPAESTIVHKNRNSHAFDSAGEIVVHDVPAVAPSHQAPTPATTPTPGESSEATEAGKSAQPTTPPARPEPPERRLVSVLGGRAKLDPHHWPLIGNTDSQHVLVELFDYTCPHCRKMNQHIHEARQRYGSELALMALPVPLSRECNDTVVSTKARHQAACELARLAIAVWRVSPESFEAYHNWLFEPEHGRSSGEAWAYASQLVGAQPLQDEMAKPIVNQFIGKHVELYKRAGQGTVPKLMFPTVTIRGEMSSADALCEVLERELFNK